MSRKELPRAGLVQAALAGKITNREGAVVLHPDHVAISGARRGGSAKMASLLCDLYAGFNDTQLTEKLREVHKLAVSRESVRLRLPLGRPAVHRCRPAQHRTRRRARPRPGNCSNSTAALSVARGAWPSAHASRRDRQCDVGGRRVAFPADRRSPRLRHAPAPGVHHLWRTRGAPWRSQQHPRAHRSALELQEELAGQQAPTHLGRVLTSLGVGYVRAHSRQAKGRVERLTPAARPRVHRGGLRFHARPRFANLAQPGDDIFTLQYPRHFD
jgi:hypothetical protein